MTLRRLTRASADRPGSPLTFEGRSVVQLGPIEESDDEYSLTTVLDAEEDYVTAAVVSWPKTPFDTWWQQESPSISSSLILPTIAYTLTTPLAASCSGDSWTMDVPTARSAHNAVWTGSEMIVWGGGASGAGNLTSGGRYNPSTDTWTPTSVGADVPSPRGGNTAIWTGEEMIIWGGQSGTTYLNTGARYLVATDTWIPTSMSGSVPTARAGHTAVWTGNEMIVWGGTGASGPVKTGGRYKPTTGGAWKATNTGGNVPYPRTSHTAVWTGTEMIIWGGVNGSLYLNSGERYNPVTNTWTDVSGGANLPLARASHTAVWAGKYMIVWGGYDGGYLSSGAVYYPAENKWWRTSTGAGTPSGRSSQTAVWTGARMIVWGGSNATTRFNDGGVYDPEDNTWSAAGSSPAPLSPRDSHSAIWTGSEMIVWGGTSDPYAAQEHTGARYSPLSNTWVPTGPDDPVARDSHTAVWTGSEMIVWGGRSDYWFKIPFNTGGLYDSSTSSWRATSVDAQTALARYGHTAIWTGMKMIVWGGVISSGNAHTNTGGCYDPMTDHWSQMSTIGAPSARTSHTAIWTGSTMIVWGGWWWNNPGSEVATGGVYDPAADSWTPTTIDGAPQARYNHTMVWTGARAIVWGGGGWAYPNSLYFDSGGLYDPLTDSWSPTGTGLGTPPARTRHTAVWTGSEMIVWGGAGVDPQALTTRIYNTGGRYDPANDMWTPTNTGLNVPTARSSHTAVWTGTEMIVWGGYDGHYLNTGGRYIPVADFWQPMNAGPGAPPPRSGHTAIATGSQIIVRYGLNNSSVPCPDGGAYCYACSASTWYRDANGDGYGNSAASASSCVQPPGFVATAGDCNDSNPVIHPGASDANCNGIDDNCNGQIDEGYVGVATQCGTGPCSRTGVTACVGGQVVDSCVPGAPTPELCNGIDDDCDGTVDNGGPGMCDDGNACMAGACTNGSCTFTQVIVPEVNDSLAVSKTASGSTISWTDAPGPFNVYRGSRTGLTWTYNEACFESGTTGPASDTDMPAAGVVIYYLVSRTGACGESALGRESSGAPIPNANPCP